ncbi:MAG TPA: phage holin family protein, partial [Tepidiformaceae bacterium]|nr:phage holin family protein [Tepidiformaceae bacterium]
MSNAILAGGMESHESGFVRRVLRLWRSEIDVAWNWPGGKWHLLRRFIGLLVFDAGALWLIAKILPGISLTSVAAAASVVLLAGAINVLGRPIVFMLVRGHDYLTLLLTLSIDTVVLLLVSPLYDGLAIDGILPAFIAGVLLAALHTTVASLLELDESETFYRNVVRKLSRDGVVAPESDVPGVVIIQIDGLSAPLFRMAIRTGQMPFLASWIRGGSHRLLDWECGLPSMTSASQAGILHGNNFDIPAFRWYEKDRRKLMVSNQPKDAAEIESRVSGEHDLLAASGVSISNLVSGHAARAMVTTSRLGSRTEGRESVTANLSGYLARPNTVFRLLTLTAWEVSTEWLQAWRQRRVDIQPRMHRGGVFPLLRASTTVVMPDLLTELVIEEMARGTPVIYADILAYDEVAHHAGPERPEAIAELQRIDYRLRALVESAARAPRPYAFVLLSDHGQSQGETFAKRYGISLQELIKSYVGGEVDVLGDLDDKESWGSVNTMLNELSREGGAAGSLTNQLLKDRREQGYLQLGPPGTDGDRGPDEDVVVTASGNLALVYFNASPERLALEDMEALYPGLVAGLVSHPG